MCGCEAHHSPGAACTCPCPPETHQQPSDVALQQQMPTWKERWGAFVQPEEEEEPKKWWERLLPFMHQSDDGPDVLQKWLYDSHKNLPDRCFRTDEVVLSFTIHSWGLGLEAENVDLSHYREPSAWRGVTLRIGPFSVTASRQRGRL